jgi:uncharacterized protein (DUF1330 family)
MAAYAVFIREETLDQSEMDIYASLAGPQFDKYSPELLAAYGAQEVVEGPATEGIVIVRFPSYEMASSWYHGPEYQAIVQHRFKGARYRGILVAGIDEPPPPGGEREPSA